MSKKHILLIPALLASSLIPNCLLAQNYTEKSFLFLWPNQEMDDAKLNLDDPLVADRPDFTEASSTVGKDVFQIESGYTFNHDDGSTGRSLEHSYPEILMRKGLFKDWFELRLGTNFSSLDSVEDSKTRHNDLYLGMKLGIAPQKDYLPELSIFPQMTVPLGSNGNDQVLPGVNISYAWSIFEDSYLGSNTQINRSESEGTLYNEYSQSVAIGTSLTDSVGGYVEWFAFFSDGLDTEDQHFLSAGFTYLFTKDVMVDLRGGHSVEQSTDNLFVGVGLTLRFID